MNKGLLRRLLAVMMTAILVAALLPSAWFGGAVYADSIPGPVITTQPTDKAVVINSVAQFTVAAKGTGTLTYRWQSRKNESSSWSNTGQSGANTATLSVSATGALHGWQFRCVVSDSTGEKAYSNAATLTVKPKIDTQPEDAYAPAGTTANFTVAATGTGTVSYQWQSRRNASATWNNSGMPGAKTATLSVNTSSGLHGWQFRCVITDGNGQHAFTNAATVYVKLAIVTQPKNTSATAGATAQFTVNAIGKKPFTYQWQSRKNASGTWSNSGQSGAKTATLSVQTVAGLNGWQFRCVVKDATGQTVVSDAATLAIVPKITTQPSNASVAVGSTAKFTVAATGKANLTYQWQSRKKSTSDWSNSGQSGAKTTTLSVNAIAGLNGWQFRCVVTDGNGQKSYSNAATLNVTPKITKQPANAKVSVGSVAQFTVAATGKTPFSYQWQSRKNASASWSNSGQTGAKTATLSVNTIAGLNGWQFRCVVTDGNGQKAYSNAATLTAVVENIPINETNFPDAVFRELVARYFDTNQDGAFSVEELKQVKLIHVPQAGITNMKGLEFFTSVETLVCYSNSVGTLDLSKNTALKSLDCSGMKLTSLNLRNNKDLEYIDFGFNNIESLDLSNNTKLTKLYCANTGLKTLNLASLTELQDLYCYYNQLEELSVSNCKKLLILHCQSNKLKELNLSANTALTDLACHINQITKLDLTANTNLTKLSVDPAVEVIDADGLLNK